MMNTVALTCFIFIVYTYFGYFLVLAIWRLWRRRPTSLAEFQPIPLAVLITAHNEEECIEQTLRSFLAADYPSEMMDIWVVSDASTDRTEETIQKKFGARVYLLRLPLRVGKVGALAAALPKINTDVVVLADASSIIAPQALRRLLSHFSLTDVGAVVGAKSIIASEGSVAPSDGLYWKYDAYLRYLETCTGSSWIGCEGTLFAIRTRLLHLDLQRDIAEDTAACYYLCTQGFRTIYDPTAKVSEFASPDAANEFRRKTRVIVRGIRALFAYWPLLNPLRHPGFFVQNLSHKLFRWLAPFALIGLWISSGYAQSVLLRHLFWMQTAFYAVAFVGLLLDKRFPGRRWPKFVSLPLYFSLVNIAALRAWSSVFKKAAVWKPSRRARPPLSRFSIEKGKKVVS